MITKGVVFELNKYRSSSLCSWNDFYGWLTKLCDGTPPSTLSSVKASLSRLSKKRAEMIRNKCADQLNELLKMPFFRQQKLESEVTSTTLDIATQKMTMATKAATTKQVKLCARNVNKKLRR